MSTEPPLHTHHAIDYLELTVTSMADAKRFYAAAFGWAFNDYGPTYAGIRDVAREGREVGGFRQDEGAVPRSGPVPLLILYSNALEVTLAAIRNAGGRIVKEPFTFPGGRRFHFVDPSGNELAVWSEK